MEVTIKLEAKDVFAFNLYHSYHRIQTWIFTVVGIVITVLSFTTFQTVDMMYTLLYFFCGLIFIFYTPFSLWTSAKLTVRGQGPLSIPVVYGFTEDGISAAYEGDTAQENDAAATSVPWDAVYKIVQKKNALYIYTSPKSASILPYAQLKDQKETLLELLNKKVESFKYGH